RLHLGFFDTMPVGRLVTRATNDVENISEMFSAGIAALVRDVFKMLGLAIALFCIDARLAGFTFLVVPLLAVGAIVFRWKVREAFRAVRVRIARINAYLQENVVGMKVVQLFTREEKSFRDFDAMNADHRDAWLQSIRYDSALFAVVEFASGITIALVIWQGAGSAAAGTIYLFIDWTRRFFLPLRDLSAKYSVMQSSMASAAFVGATGAGKTTIIKLLTRLYDVDRGSIRIDGVDLREWPQSELRRRVAMVLQDVFLFSGTIEHNLALGRDEIDRERVQRAA